MMVSMLIIYSASPCQLTRSSVIAAHRVGQLLQVVGGEVVLVDEDGVVRRTSL